MKIIKTVTAALLSLAILIPSCLLWSNVSYIHTVGFSVLSAMISGVRHPGKSLSKATQEIDKASSDYIGFHNAFVTLYGLGMRLCGSRLVNIGDRSVVKLDTGGICEYNNDPASVQAEAEATIRNAASLAALKDQLDERGIPLLFILAPGKTDKYEPALPYQLYDYSNAAADSFLKELDKYGIDYLDLREVWHQKGWRTADGFFQSDLHWRPAYAIRSWAYVTQYLNDHCGIPNDPSLFDPENLTVEKYNNVSLGGTGRLIGRFYAETDSTELYLPKYETLFHVVNKRVGWDKTGSFEETTVDRSPLNRGSLFLNDLIDMYHARDSVVENKMPPNDADVVFVRDSFGGMLGGYVPLAFRNTSIIDLRTMGERKGETVLSIVDGFDTDLVLFFYHIGMVDNKEMFAF